MDDLNEADGLMVLEPREQFDSCIIGIGRRFHDTFVVYSEPDVIAALVAEMDEDDEDPETSAREHFEFNIIGGWIGDTTPAFVTVLDVLELEAQLGVTGEGVDPLPVESEPTATLGL